jgi:hypothetical protein
MENYECELCNYNTKYSGNYNKHLTTNKHKRKTAEENGCSEILEDIKVINENEKTQKDPQKTQKDPQKTQKDPQKTQNNSEEIQNNCNYCKKEFSSYAHKRRHELHRCQEVKEDVNSLYKSDKKEWLKEKKILFKQIDELIKKAGNTTNTNTNNLNLNSYGNEDLSHITNSFKTQMLKGPFEMIPKMIEEVHFNDKKPENKNICYPNKKNNTVKIFKEGKWKYCNKEDLMDELMGNNYCILDVYYDEKKDDILSDIQKKRYLNFKDIYNSGKLDKGTKGEINLLLLNCDEY